jgi:outer membrane receptor protein involved in Fe transport
MPDRTLIAGQRGRLKFSPFPVNPNRLLRDLGVGGLGLLFLASTAHADPMDQVRFVVLDPQTHRPLAGAQVQVEETSGKRHRLTLYTDRVAAGPTPTLDVAHWRPIAMTAPNAVANPTVIVLSPGETVRLPAPADISWASPTTARRAGGTQAGQQPPAQAGQQQPPVRDIYIVVRATRLARQSQATPANSVNRTQIQERAGAGNNIQNVIKTDAGVASDSNGQQHVRGEHAEVAYVVDGVQLPDTLSGRQGSIVVLSTIQSLDLLTGAYPPEFGGQTAAILDITTLPGARKAHADLNLQYGNYDTTNGDLTWVGPLGKYASYVFDLGATRTRLASEPQQPTDQTAHNTGASLNEFAKFRFTPSHNDTLTLTLSRTPDTQQINNRTGLPASFAQAGEGFGFLGMRNADGSRPDVTSQTAGLLGAQGMVLPSQQADGMDINQSEVSEFATFSWRRNFGKRVTGLLAVTSLHSGQDVTNNNPGVNLLNLPVDNSIEYNPTAIRNVHHTQFVGSLAAQQGKHALKTGFLVDDQYGNETYQLIPASQLALDQLAVTDPVLAPAGVLTPQLNSSGQPVTDSSGNPVYVKDVNGNPVYHATSGTSPILSVHRSGFYRAAYIQDNWQESRRFTINYGVRADWYKQSQNLGQSTVDAIAISPRFNFAYTPDRLTSVRWSYNRLFNTPPLAQGSVVGAPIQPEILNQYDISVQRQIGVGQTLGLAYYIKDIRNQVDTGLLIPGSMIGIYSAVNFQIGGVHGIEFSYDISPPKGAGIDAFVNYSYSIAAPNGLDNTGAPAPDYNDHDQRNTIGSGIGYTWKNGANSSLTLAYGSGLASSAVYPSTLRTPRSQVDLHFGTGGRFIKGHGGLNLDIQNLFDDRTVINFQSGFSGTRFQPARRILLSLTGSF